MNPKTFVSRLKLLLKQANRSIPDLCSALDLKERTVRSWLSGDSKPSEESMVAVEIKLKAAYKDGLATIAALENFLKAA